MLRLLSLSPSVWIGVAAAVAAVLAAIVGYGAYREHKGSLKTAIEVRERDARRVQTVRNINHGINQTTLQQDAELIRKLREIDEKWLTPKPQDAEPRAQQPSQQSSEQSSEQ